MSTIVLPKNLSKKSSLKISFLLAEYSALRAEILDLKNKINQLKIIGITSIPLLVGAVVKYEMDFILIVAPIIVVVFLFLILSEQCGIMRIGAYIRTEIEAKAKIEGWETWLETRPPENRISEIFFLWSVIVVFCTYYVGSSYLAWEILLMNYSAAAAWFSLGAYGLVLFIMIGATVVFFPIGSKHRTKK